MKPTDFQKLSVLYLYNEISAKEKKIFEKHLESCEKCRNELKSMKKVVDSLEALPEECPDDKVKQQIIMRSYANIAGKKTFSKKAALLLMKHQRVFRALAALLIFIAGLTMIISYVQDQTALQMKAINKPNETVYIGEDNREDSLTDLCHTVFEERIYNLYQDLENSGKGEFYTNLDNAIDFYQEKSSREDFSYSPFIDSRPYRELVSLQNEAYELKLNIVSLME